MNDLSSDLTYDEMNLIEDMKLLSRRVSLAQLRLDPFQRSFIDRMTTLYAHGPREDLDQNAALFRNKILKLIQDYESIVRDSISNSNLPF